MTTLETVRLEDTAFGTLASQHRLLNAVLKEPLPKAGTFGFRGDIALAFQDQALYHSRVGLHLQHRLPEAVHSAPARRDHREDPAAR